jgi:hypothetical protein
MEPQGTSTVSFSPCFEVLEELGGTDWVLIKHIHGGTDKVQLSL